MIGWIKNEISNLYNIVLLFTLSTFTYFLVLLEVLFGGIEPLGNVGEPG